MSTLLSTDIVVSAVIVLIAGFAIYKKTDLFGAFLKGAGEGIRSAAAILPALCFLMTAIGMFRQSGAIEFITNLISPCLLYTS